MKTKTLSTLFSLGIVMLIAFGLAWAGSQGGLRALGMPLFMLSIGLAFIIQWIAFIPAFIFQTEKFYDLTGSLTYISITAAALILSGSIDARSYILAGMVILWAVRLGTFLFRRILKSGKDSRFDAIKPDFPALPFNVDHTGLVGQLYGCRGAGGHQRAAQDQFGWLRAGWCTGLAGRPGH